MNTDQLLRPVDWTARTATAVRPITVLRESSSGEIDSPAKGCANRLLAGPAAPHRRGKLPVGLIVLALWDNKRILPGSQRAGSWSRTMEWHQYLRAERAQKIEGLMRFLSGDLAMIESRQGERMETTDQAIERLRRNIAEIEQILASAGIPLEEDRVTVHLE